MTAVIRARIDCKIEKILREMARVERRTISSTVNYLLSEALLGGKKKKPSRAR